MAVVTLHRPLVSSAPVPERALVVAADPALRAYLTAVLQEQEYAVAQTDSVFGAPALVREVAPALIVLDAALPYRSGLSLLVHLKADPPTAAIPVVVLAGVPDAFPPARQQLAAAVVRTPYRVDALRAALHAVRADREGVQAVVAAQCTAPEARVARADTTPRTIRPAARAARVLVVDDDPSVTALVSAALTEEGYVVETAPDGATALTLLVEQSPDIPAVILLDMRMPVMDGATFARQYRDTPGPHAPLICFTDARTARDQCAAIGAAGFLGKPFPLRDLRALIGRHAPHAA
jgi:CheY-like chemotaxis protein